MTCVLRREELEACWKESSWIRWNGPHSKESKERPGYVKDATTFKVHTKSHALRRLILYIWPQVLEWNKHCER